MQSCSIPFSLELHNKTFSVTLLLWVATDIADESDTTLFFCYVFENAAILFMYASYAVIILSF